MGWSQQVHESRAAASLARARSDYRLQRRGYSVPIDPDTQLAPFEGLVAALSGRLGWRKEGRRVRARDWRRLPLLRQLYEFVTTQQVSASSSVAHLRQQKSVPKTRKPPVRVCCCAGRLVAPAAARREPGCGACPSPSPCWRIWRAKRSSRLQANRQGAAPPGRNAPTDERSSSSSSTAAAAAALASASGGRQQASSSSSAAVAADTWLEGLPTANRGAGAGGKGGAAGGKSGGGKKKGKKKKWPGGSEVFDGRLGGLLL
jgi:hypothetical protein